MGDRGHKPRHVSSLCRWNRPGSLPWSSQKGTKPTHTLISAQGDPCQTCDLQNSKMINLCCFKPLNLWWFVTVANQKLTHSSLRPTLPGSPLLPGSPQSSWLAPPAPHRAYLTPSPSIFHPRVISPRLTALQFMSPDKTSLTLLDSAYSAQPLQCLRNIPNRYSQRELLTPLLQPPWSQLWAPTSMQQLRLQMRNPSWRLLHPHIQSQESWHLHLQKSPCFSPLHCFHRLSPRLPITATALDWSPCQSQSSQRTALQIKNPL